jgi:hypothetical protein
VCSDAGIPVAAFNSAARPGATPEISWLAGVSSSTASSAPASPGFGRKHSPSLHRSYASWGTQLRPCAVKTASLPRPKTSWKSNYSRGWGSPRSSTLAVSFIDDPYVRGRTAAGGRAVQRTPGVALSEDAAHVMPAVGDGANLSIFDSPEPAQESAQEFVVRTFSIRIRWVPAGLIQSGGCDRQQDREPLRSGW